MTYRPSSWPGIAVVLSLGGCGVASPPPRAVDAPPPKLAETPPAPKAVEAPLSRAGEAPLPQAEAPPLEKVEASPAPQPAHSTAPPKVATASKVAPPKADVRAVPAAPTPPPKAPAPVEARATAPPLDLKSLEQRLKQTGAIGVLTKLSLKNQVDDLIARFRAFHAGQRPPTIPELRPAYDLLLMKVLSLLQDKDPALAKDIDLSRNAIWSLLTDREKLATHN